jgi:hypothetical protein
MFGATDRVVVVTRAGGNLGRSGAAQSGALRQRRHHVRLGSPLRELAARSTNINDMSASAPGKNPME